MSSTRTDRIDGVQASTALKAPCVAATTGNITLSGAQTIDGVAVVANNRVLVKDQTDAVENGIYIASNTSWERSPDFDGARDVVQGTTVRVYGGSVNAGTWWELTTANTVTIDTDEIEFQQVTIPASNALDYFSATSTTSLAIGTGGKSFTTQAGKSFVDGAYIIATSDADPTNYMHGYVSSYTGTTLLLVITNVGGSGTHADWTLSVSGSRGATGAAGSGLANVVDDATPQLGGTLDTNAHLVQYSKGADVASATALTLGTDGNYFDITGTTTITSIATTGKVGTVVKLHFDGILTLTHHATDLVLPSGANITTAAGDEAEFVEYAAGDFRCTSYTRASGSPLIGGGSGWIPIKTQTAANVSSVDFVNGSGGVVLDSTYRAYVIVITSLVPATDNTNLLLRTSSNAGSSYDSGASDYKYALGGADSTTGTYQGAVSNGTTSILSALDVGNSAGEQSNAVIYLYNPAGTKYFVVGIKSETINASGNLNSFTGSGTRLTAADVDAIRFLMSSGNISSGTFTLYGIADA